MFYQVDTLQALSWIVIFKKKITEVRKKNFFAYYLQVLGKNYYSYLAKIDSLKLIYVYVPKSWYIFDGSTF